MGNRGENMFEIIVFGVGQADCIHVTLSDGRQFLVDTGFKKTFRGVRDKLLKLNKDIEFIILTHDHSDHTSALEDFINEKQFSIKSVLLWLGEPRRDPLSIKRWSALESKLRQQEISVFSIKRAFQLSDMLGEHIKVLFPQKETSYNSASINNNSIVLALDYYNQTFLLMADAPRESERLLITRQLVPNNTRFIKIGHHGSKSSSSKEFFEASMNQGCNPELVCSCNGNYTVPPPHDETIDIIKALNLDLKMTGISGKKPCNIRIQALEENGAIDVKWGEI